MAIQNRRGSYGDFDPDKMVAGEFAVVQDNDPDSSTGRSLYICFEPGVVKRVADYEDIQDIVADVAEGYIEDFDDAVTAVTTLIPATEQAKDDANAAASAANAAATYALSATSKHYFGTNNSGDATTSTANITGFTLETGVVVGLYCTVALGANLNISNTGAKAVYYRGSTKPSVMDCKYSIVTLFYDGTRYQIIAVVGPTVIPYDITISSVSSLPVTENDNYINKYMVCTHAELSDPSAQKGDWTVTTANGSVTISGTIVSGKSTNIRLVLETAQSVTYS